MALEGWTFKLGWGREERAPLRFHQLIPVCVPGPNCFAGTTIIPAGIEVKVDECNICHCHNGDWWKPAQCSKRECQGKQIV